MKQEIKLIVTGKITIPAITEPSLDATKEVGLTFDKAFITKAVVNRQGAPGDVVSFELSVENAALSYI